jgi:hypothetical protein
MSAEACEALRSWGSSLVVVRRRESKKSARQIELVLRLVGVGVAAGHRPVLHFDRQSVWRFADTAKFEVSADSLVALEADGAITQVGRLRLPPSTERALHVGQWSTRDLEVRSISATPGWTGSAPPPRPTKSLVIWTDFGAHSRLALWWACAAHPRVDPVAVVAMPRREPDLDEICFIRSPGELIDAAAGVRFLTRRQVSRFSANWRNWCGGRPPHAVDLADWPEESAWVGQVPTPIWNLFPRSHKGALALSKFDQLILEHVSSDWSTPLDAYVRMVRRDLPMASTWGDLKIAARIGAWGNWQAGRFVARRRGKGDGPMTRWEYRLTEAGLALMQQMTALEDAPRLKMGGFSFYSPQSWVLADGVPARWRR